MADVNTTERNVSLIITVRVSSISTSQARELEDKVRDLTDDYGADVQATSAPERPTLAGR